VNRFLLALLLVSSAIAQNAWWIDISGEWRRSNDDRREFASSDFDDSSWDILQLPSRRRTTACWLRRRVEIPAGAQKAPLSLTVGTIQTVYEVYVDGRRIGETPGFDDYRQAQISRPRTFDIPPDVLAGKKSIVVAIHRKSNLYMPPQWRLADSGPYLITSRSIAPVDAGRHAIAEAWLGQTLENILTPALAVIPILSFLAWLSDRRRRELLWFTLASVAYVVWQIENLAAYSDASRPFNAIGYATGIAFLDAALAGQFTLVVLAIRSRWPYVLLWIGWVASAATMSSQQYYAVGARAGMIAMASIPIAAIAVDWRRLRGKHAPLLDHLFRFALLLSPMNTLQFWISQAMRRPAFTPSVLSISTYRISLGGLFWLLVSSGILAMLLRRAFNDRQERRRLADELEAARLVQQVLLRASSANPALSVDAVYRPAEEVGGDFYQVYDHSDGSTVVVAGDVSGKGLRAAMLVSVAVGALRRDLSEPAQILAAMNDTLVHHVRGGFVTCCCISFQPSGRVAIASAGHPAPYCNGREVELTPGLALGVVQAPEYAPSEVALSPGDVMTLVSDGVVEAANSSGELFGFARTAAMSMKPAADIADIARAWGQNDDITVVTIRRAAACGSC